MKITGWKKVYGSKRKLLRRITRTEPRDSSRNLSAIFSTREISFPFQTLNFGLQFEKLAVKECRGIQREKFGGNFVENSSGLRDFKQKSVIRQNEQTWSFPTWQIIANNIIRPTSWISIRDKKIEERDWNWITQPTVFSLPVLSLSFQAIFVQFFNLFSLIGNADFFYFFLQRKESLSFVKTNHRQFSTSSLIRFGMKLAGKIIKLVFPQ